MGASNTRHMFVVLSGATELPVNAIGWLVTVLGLVFVALWMRYLYR